MSWNPLHMECLPWPALSGLVLRMPCVILLAAALCCMVQRQKPLLCTGRCKTMPWDIAS